MILMTLQEPWSTIGLVAIGFIVGYAGHQIWISRRRDE